ncbi:MAG: ATP-binding cassette domain-containing protein [Spirochaetes bacterium]|nr:ATP-binding cassette domain-containing protein [Spirochaetota bacterium]
MAQWSEPIIELSHVSASSGGFEILRDADASFYAGEITVVMGSAGAGKSTLLKAAAGLVVPDAGTVKFFGKSIASFNRKEELEFRRRTSYVFQDAALWANTSILGNLTLPLSVHCAWMNATEMERAARVVAEKVGYLESLSMRPAELSIGEQKLISLARALVTDPELVFMDDPTSHLDEDAVDRVFGILGELKMRDRTVIMVTNNSDIAFRHADRLGIVRDGVIPILGPYDEIVNNEAHEFVGIVSRLKIRGERTRGEKTSKETEQ